MFLYDFDDDNSYYTLLDIDGKFYQFAYKHIHGMIVWDWLSIYGMLLVLIIKFYAEYKLYIRKNNDDYDYFYHYCYLYCCYSAVAVC